MLEEYRQKRNFSKTKEPSVKKEKVKKNKLSFVIQHHLSRKEHWDFRLEVGGVMPSWAITKEPNGEDKRLAVKTEDHPLEYAKFHGKIPKGQYGAGTVKIWDKGKYENARDYMSMEDSIKEGKVEVELKGKKLKGRYALVKMKPNERYPKENNWLFFRMKKWKNHK